MQRIMTGELYRTTVLCIDEYEQGVPFGRFYNLACGGCTFRGLTQFLTKMEGMLDKLVLPQSFTAARTFVDGGTVQPMHDVSEQICPGRAATFAIRILFRQNASWQGSVKWLEGNMEQSFRSALELIFLIDSVLSDMDGEQAG